MDIKNMEAMGEMEKIEDEGYGAVGVQVFLRNFQKIQGNWKNLAQSVNDLHCYRVKYLKITVKRPVVTFI